MSDYNSIKEASFTDLGISSKLLGTLKRLGFTIPTPIQRQAIPVASTGRDVIGIAQTGTGKTLAFVLPMLQQIARTKKQGLIIVPTRELAMQVEEQLVKIGADLGLRHALVIGGMSILRQAQDIRRQPHVIIGTPGRIIDHLRQGHLKLHNIGVLVLDEGDRMLDMGFAPQIKAIMQHVPKQRQTMLFSATMPSSIVSMAAAYLKTPARVEVSQSGTVVAKINQELFVVPRDHKNRLLSKLLDTNAGTVLVFSRTKYGAKKVCRVVRGLGHSAAEIHSNLSLSQRRRSLAGFKSGIYRVLVATDIASRGIDVINIGLVINYDLPDNLDDYVHRVGRTGRAGRDGQAISFITPDERGKIRIIERLVRQTLTISPLPVLPVIAQEAAASRHTPWSRSSHQPNARRFQKRTPARHQRSMRVHT